MANPILPTDKTQNRINNQKMFLGYSFFISGAIGAFSTIDTLFYLAKGLSFEQIALLAMLLNVLIFLSEIPLGVLADKIGTLNTLIIGVIIRACAALFFIADIQGNFIIATVLAAVGIAFISGADSATLMKINQGKETTEKLFSSLRLYNGLGAILGGGIGYLLFQQNVDYPWLFSFCLSTIALLLLVKLRRGYYFPAEIKYDDVPNFAEKPPIVSLIKSLIMKRFFWG